ncbi:MAG: alkylhydroperoxidase, partial [Chitinophagia bacterium]|nr:alkylhydroperoxidase [Chitinophagia bacterium]
MTNETIISLFTALGITESTPSHALAQLAATDSKYLRDLKLNVLSTLQSKHLTPKEAYIIALSVAINQQCAP